MEKVLVIVGPTGVGKTGLSIELASLLQGEIISGDSMQVYKEMSIGTAKIKEEEKENIPHFLIDSYSYKDDYNVKIFQEKARTYIDEITKHNHLPMICGGTGLYIKSTLFDYQFLEQKQDQEFMNFLSSRSDDERWGLLTIVDPKACETIHAHNRQRVIRALYMAHTGVKKSDVIDSQIHAPIYDAYIIGLTMQRDALYERINQRVDTMMREGLLTEIDTLVKSNEDVWSLQSFQGIGYKEWKAYYEGSSTKEECIELIKKNSRNFAKRQYTWFKNQLDVHWYDIYEPEYKDKILKDIREWMKRG